MAAQGDPARRGPEGAPRRGRGLSREETRRRAARRGAAGFDPYAFTVAFKGVLLEGLEVAFIVLTFGANQHDIALAALAAALAIAARRRSPGSRIRAPLARVPENTMKFAVGVMLTSFGTFWGAEGAGASLAGERRRAARDHPGLLAISLAFVALIAPCFAASRARPRPTAGSGA